MVDCPGERDELPLADRETLERFDNARNKLHKLMQRWDELPIGKGAIIGKNETQVGGAIRVIDESEIGITCLVPQPECGAIKGCYSGDKRLMLVLDIKIMDRPKGGVTAAIRPKLVKQ